MSSKWRNHIFLNIWTGWNPYEELFKSKQIDEIQEDYPEEKKKTVGIEICHTVEMVYILKLD